MLTTGVDSSSTMVSTALLLKPSVAPPVGLASVRFTVWFGFWKVLSLIMMVKVFFVSPGAKVRVFETER